MYYGVQDIVVSQIVMFSEQQCPLDWKMSQLLYQPSQSTSPPNSRRWLDDSATNGRRACVIDESVGSWQDFIRQSRYLCVFKQSSATPQLTEKHTTGHCTMGQFGGELDTLYKLLHLSPAF